MPELGRNEFEIEIIDDTSTGAGGATGEYRKIAEADVPDEISKAQATLLRNVGKRPDDMWIVADEIRLRVRGPDVLDIILVDLPGLIESAPDNVTDDELKSLKRQLTSVIGNYARRPETLLAVVQMANEDIERVPAVRLAHEFDPTGTRTFKILNKFDKIDSMLNKKRAVACVNDGAGSDYGPHALIRRTEDGDMKDAGEEIAELQALGVRDERGGIAQLKARLEQMFARLIDVNLPNLHKSIDVRLAQAEKLLDGVGREETPAHEMLRDFVLSMERGESELTKTMTPAVTRFGDAVHGERRAVTLKFVSEGYEHDAAKPSELQLEENFKRSLVRVTGLWRPHLDEYTAEVSKILTDWFSSKVASAAQRSAGFGSALSEQIQIVRQDLVGRFREGCLAALDAELDFSSINDHYFGAKKQKYDVFPKEMEDWLMASIVEMGRKGELQKAVQQEAAARTVWRSAGEQNPLRLKMQELRDGIKTRQEDMTERNKQETHSLVMANFDVSCKTFRDNVWKRTLEMVRPSSVHSHLTGSKKRRRNWAAASVMDWVRLSVLSDGGLLKVAVEDEATRGKRAELIATIKRLKLCVVELRKMGTGGEFGEVERGVSPSSEGEDKTVGEDGQQVSGGADSVRGCV